MPTFTPVSKLDTFGRHLVDTTLHRLFGELHIGDAILQQSTDAIGTFQHGDVMAYLIQLVGSGQAGWTATDDRDFLAGA